MNAEPKKTDRSNDRPSFRNALKQAPKRFMRSCAHNWGWKLLCLFLAISLWAGLITQDPTLTRERVFADVPVSVTGADTLMRNGLVVLSGLEAESLLTRMRVDVPQRAYSTTLSSNYNPRIDLSRITEVGEQTLRIQTSSSTTYGIVDTLTPDTVTVVVDEYVTNYRVPVSLNTTGDYPTGYYGATPLLDPSSVAVSGPKSIVDRVAHLYVDYDPSRLAAQEGQVRTALPMRFTDADGNDISGEMLSVTSANVELRTITVDQRLYPTKTLAVSNLALTEGTPASGYELKSVTAVPGTIMAAGDASALEALDTLFVDSPVDITDRSESFVAEIELRRPSSLSYLSDSSITLQIEIAPILITRTFENLRVSVRNAADGLTAQLDENRVTVNVTGPQNIVEQLSASALNAYVNAADLTAGEHVLPVVIEVSTEQNSAISYGITPASLNLVLSE